MIYTRLLRQISFFLLYIILQGLIIQHFILFDVAFCFLYIAYILQMPYDTPRPVVLIVAFLAGILVDMFYNTLGIHAAACVLTAYLRRYMIILLTPVGGYEGTIKISAGTLGFRWFFTYTAPLVFIHHFVFFFLESFSFTMFGWTLLKVIASSLFSIFMIFIFQYLIHVDTSKR